MVYNTTNITAANDMYGIALAVNELSGGVMFGLLLMILFVMFIVVFHKMDFKKVFVADSFFVTFVAALMWGMGYIGFNILVLPIVLLLTSLIVFLFVD